MTALPGSSGHTIEFGTLTFLALNLLVAGICYWLAPPGVEVQAACALKALHAVFTIPQRHAV